MTLIDEFLQMKEAASLGGMGRGVRDFASNVGRGALEKAPGALATAGVGAGMAGAGMAVSKIYDALTKRRDFRTMLEYNPHLADAQAQDPKRFNQLYSTLRTMNPDFARDPIVAGTYMDRMVQNPSGAGGVAAEAMSMRDKMKSPVGETMRGALLKGLGR